MTAFKILKLLFCFKKPEVLNLSYLHVLIRDKPTLFVVWEIKNVWSVKLIPLDRSYYIAQNAIIISIPKDQNQVTLKAANFWKKTNIGLAMCTVQFDEVSTAQFIQGFRPLNKLEVCAPVVFNIKNKLAIKPVSIKQRNSFIKKIDCFNINVQRFNYP
jgi:hypothetical protein